MATSKLLKPTNVTISIPEFTDQPDQRVNSNCIDKEADAINTLSDQTVPVSGTLTSQNVTLSNETTLYKVGHIVIFQLVYKPTTDIPAWTTFVTIPEGFRPSKAAYGIDIQSSTAGAHYEIYTDGSVVTSFLQPNNTQRRSCVFVWVI